MNLTLLILGCVALLAFIALLIYLIGFIRETKLMIADAKAAINTLTGEVNQRLNAVDSILANANAMSTDLATAVDDATDVVREGRNVIVSILDLEQTLQRSIMDPVVETVTVLSALGKGMRAFRLKMADKIDGGLHLNGHDHRDSRVPTLTTFHNTVDLAEQESGREDYRHATP